jgi:hypothetical protein
VFVHSSAYVGGAAVTSVYDGGVSVEVVIGSAPDSRVRRTIQPALTYVFGRWNLGTMFFADVGGENTSAHQEKDVVCYIT